MRSLVLPFALCAVLLAPFALLSSGNNMVFAAEAIVSKVVEAKDSQEQILAAKKARHRADVVFVRGGFNVFSNGLDEMAKKLVKQGVKVDVVSHNSEQAILQRIIDNRKRFGAKPIVLVGHSWGANAVIRIAQGLRKKGIRVNYMATFAATNPGKIPSNVRKATNYYFAKDGWGKPVARGPGARGNIKNIDLSKTAGVHHFNIEEFPKLQRQVIRNVMRFIGRKGRA